MLKREFLFGNQRNLSTHKGLGLPRTSYVAEEGTVGGAINTAPSGVLSGAHGRFADAIQQLEIVLSNGDVIQTGRISRRELSKKKRLIDVLRARFIERLTI